MFAKALQNVSHSVGQSVSRAIERSEWPGFSSRGNAKAGDTTQGFYESSFDLRTGLEVSEAPSQVMTEDLAREFRRQQSS
jgi:hypothetical protein